MNSVYVQVSAVSTPMPLMQQMMRPAMALAPTPPQFAHMMRPGGPMGIAPGMYTSFQLNHFN